MNHFGQILSINKFLKNEQNKRNFLTNKKKKKKKCRDISKSVFAAVASALYKNLLYLTRQLSGTEQKCSKINFKMKVRQR